MFCIGVDIGGTKCAVVIGKIDGHGFEIVEKERFDTDEPKGPSHAVERILDICRRYTEKYSPVCVGVSCGSPLDIKRGIIQSPPNLPSWKNVHITELITEATGLPSAVRNDADASALAEYRFGAGKGSMNMIFLTFGTGLGAGLILGGSLYTGKSGTAGEVGHIRLEKDGPVGYGVKGSFEGFCSGGGIRQLCLARGRDVTAKEAAMLARSGDTEMLEVYEECGTMLGRGLAVLCDILDPDVIVIGSIFERAEELIRPSMERALKENALPSVIEGLRIVPAALGENIGDAAALAVAELCVREAK